MSRTSLIAHRLSVCLMGAAVLIATGVGFAHSWAGLYGWAASHGLTGWKAASFPGMVDLFIAVGELGLFALALEGHRLRKSGLSWLDLAVPGGCAIGGWLVSVVFNIGHADHKLAEQVTAAVPPVAAMLGLLVLLRTLHRFVTTPDRAGEDGEKVVLTLPEAVAQLIEGGMSQRQIAEELNASRDKIRAVYRQARPQADRVAELPTRGEAMQA